MMDWLGKYYLGIFGTWFAIQIYERLCVWWQEGKTDMKVEVLEHDDPRLTTLKPWERRP